MIGGRKLAPAVPRERGSARVGRDDTERA